MSFPVTPKNMDSKVLLYCVVFLYIYMSSAGAESKCIPFTCDQNNCMPAADDQDKHITVGGDRNNYIP